MLSKKRFQSKVFDVIAKLSVFTESKKLSFDSKTFSIFMLRYKLCRLILSKEQIYLGYFLRFFNWLTGITTATLSKKLLATFSKKFLKIHRFLNQMFDSIDLYQLQALKNEMLWILFSPSLVWLEKNFLSWLRKFDFMFHSPQYFHC